VSPLPLPSISLESLGLTGSDSKEKDKEHNIQDISPSKQITPALIIEKEEAANNQTTLSFKPIIKNTIIKEEDPAPPGIVPNISEYDFSAGGKDFNAFDTNFQRNINLFMCFSCVEPLDPPPLSQFLSMDNLVCFCQLWAKNHGYTIFKANLHPGKNVYIKCDRSGHFCGAILNQSGRKTATLKTNCPFHVKGSIPTSKKISKVLDIAGSQCHSQPQSI
jgi:hypothetical protein